MTSESHEADDTDPTQVPREADSAAPYNFEIDMKEDTTHTAVVRLVGAGKRVLELGPATGYMSKVFRDRDCSVVGVEVDPGMAESAAQYCERVIVGDIESLDFESEFGADRFDVIVAADVLEHLKDPLTVLRNLASYLTPELGFFVVSLPNVAHGSVRLALLEGDFSYQRHGLLDKTHLRFFTRATIEKLFDDADLAIVEIDRRVLNIDASEVQFNRSSVSDDLLAFMERDPDARTYQFVLRAEPVSHPGVRHFQRRLREQALAVDDARKELAQVRRELAHVRDEEIPARDEEFQAQALQTEELRTALASLSAREGQIRSRLVDAHDQVLRRDQQIEEMNGELERLQARIVELDSDREALAAERDRVVGENRDVWHAQNEARVIIGARDTEIARLRVRLNRIHNILPIRIWRRLSRLPFVRLIVARRTAGYEAEVSRDVDTGS